MDESGEELAAIYHSHTKSPAYPSQTDINLAAYPGVVYLIVSLAEGEEPLRGFEIELRMTLEALDADQARAAGGIRRDHGVARARA